MGQRKEQEQEYEQKVAETWHTGWDLAVLPSVVLASRELFVSHNIPHSPECRCLGIARLTIDCGPYSVEGYCLLRKKRVRMGGGKQPVGERVYQPFVYTLQ